MKSNKYALTVADVARCWWVDETGTVRWQQSVEPVPNNCLHLFNGTVAGQLRKTNPSGLQHRRITYTKQGRQTRVYAHIIAYVLHNGKFPDSDVDHIDGNGLNNLGTNLRDVTRRVNLCNAQLYQRNVTGVKGVTPVKRYPGRWEANASVGGKKHNLYTGYDFFLACCARLSFEAHNDADKAYSGRGNLKGSPCPPHLSE